MCSPPWNYFGGTGNSSAETRNFIDQNRNHRRMGFSVCIGFDTRFICVSSCVEAAHPNKRAQIRSALFLSQILPAAFSRRRSAWAAVRLAIVDHR
jgi:hypothetical protein